MTQGRTQTWTEWQQSGADGCCRWCQFLFGKEMERFSLVSSEGFGGVVTGFQKLVYCGKESLGVDGPGVYEV